MFKNQKYFARYAWIYLFYNLYVVLGGAYVRATGSGAGCGNHWPLCTGAFVPDLSVIHTIIEFTHRISSAIVTIGVILLVVWSFTSTSKASPIRKAASFSFLFIVVEALLGAALVKFDLVANNSSNFRAVMMALHLVTTFMLLASIALTAFWASNFPVMKIVFPKKNVVLILCLVLALLLVGASGAITALGDTLFRPL
jgi:cytochrome c oxidase assembly protein subunit 15